MFIPLKKIISGGQTGVDQAALKVAMDMGYTIGGWCPPGRRCEAGTIPDEFPLVETPVDKSPEALNVPRSQRTEWNVRDADALLVILPHRTAMDAGTAWAVECAERSGKPCLTIDPEDKDDREKVAKWLSEQAIVTLNVAGPSERASPGIYRATIDFLYSALKGSRVK